MHTKDLLLACWLTASIACGSTEKPFDQMTSLEHRREAAREHHLADEAFDKITGENIEPPETHWWGYENYDPRFYPYPYGVVGDPGAYTAWPRITDPDEKYQDAASKHRERALRHEWAASALEGKPSPQPLPPPQPPLIPPDDA